MPRPWTKADDERLIRDYKRHSDSGQLEGFAAFLGQTPKYIERRAAELGIIEKTTPQFGPKYNWKPCWKEVGGQRCFFRSQWEANYAVYLQHLLETGKIRAWEHEPHTFWFERIRRGVRSYKPDFKVTTADGDIEWHEVKGYMDRKSQTKLNRMARYYPGETVVLIDSEAYAKIKRDYGAMRGWQ